MLFRRKNFEKINTLSISSNQIYAVLAIFAWLHLAQPPLYGFILITCHLGSLEYTLA